MPEAVDEKFSSVLKALGSDRRREIVKIAAEGAIDESAAYSRLVELGYNIKDKSYCYRDLQMLVSAGVLDKVYDNKSKSVLYKLNVDRIVIEPKTMKIDMEYSSREVKKSSSDTSSAINALDSELRRKIMRTLSENPGVGLKSEAIFDMLTSRGVGISHEESIYKQLQVLADASLLEKYYDMGQKAILYKPKIGKLVLDTRTMESDLLIQPVLEEGKLK